MNNGEHFKRRPGESHVKMASVAQLRSRKALVVGFSCRALAQSVRRSGMDPWVIDCCGDLDTLDIATRYSPIDSLDNCPLLTETIASWRSEGEFGGVFFAGGIERLPSIYLAPNVSSGSISFSRMRSWETWMRWALQSGMEFPETHSIVGLKSSGHVLPWTEGENDDTWLIKDHWQAGGLGISRFDPVVGTRNFEWGRNAWESSDRLLLQRQIEGEGVGVSFLSGKTGAVAIGGVNALPLHPHPWSDFIYRGSSGPMALEPQEWERLDNFAERVTQESGWLGVWNADFLRTADDRWVLLEINPRWSAGMELLDRNWEHSIAWHHHNVCGNALEPLFWDEQKRLICRERLQIDAPVRKEILYLAKPWRATERAITGMWERRWEIPFTSSEPCWVADIPRADTELGAGFPLCSLFTRMDDENESDDVAKNAKVWLEQELDIPICP